MLGNFSLSSSIIGAVFAMKVADSEGRLEINLIICSFIVLIKRDRAGIIAMTTRNMTIHVAQVLFILYFFSFLTKGSNKYAINIPTANGVITELVRWMKYPQAINIDTQKTHLLFVFISILSAVAAIAVVDFAFAILHSF